MNRKYGVPYKGSKSVIAKKIVDMLPPAENFYDLFAGGGAITQCAIESGKYQNVFANDADGRALRLFVDASNWMYRNEKRWVSREEFMANKALPVHEQDPYIACCWSFGNNMRDYLYSKTLEPIKRATHYAVALDDWTQLDEIDPQLSAVLRAEIAGAENVSERRRLFSAAVRHAQKRGIGAQITPTASKRIEFEALERLERLERLQALENADKLNEANVPVFDYSKVTFLDYRNVLIRPNSVIYCDPPYAGTNPYSEKFDNEAFCEWALEQTEPVFISEYDMPDRFIRIASFAKQQNISATVTRVVSENLYIPYNQKSTTEQQVSLIERKRGGQNGV